MELPIKYINQSDEENAAMMVIAGGAKVKPFQECSSGSLQGANATEVASQ